MRKLILLSLLCVLFLYTTGAAVVDDRNRQKEGQAASRGTALADAREGGQAGNAEIMQLLKGQGDDIHILIQMMEAKTEPSESGFDRVRHNEIVGALNEQRDVIRQLVQRLEIPVPQPVSQPLPQPVPQTAVTPIAAAPPVLSNPGPQSRWVSFRDRLGNFEPVSLLALILSAASTLLFCFLLINMKQTEVRLKKMLMKTELETLRSHVKDGRPRLKITTEGDNIDLFNIGEAIATEIKLLVGPAPASMKQKLKTAATILVGDKTRIQLPPRMADELLYASLEYKSAESGRIYKDQFVLKFDRMTGHILPIQEAS